LDRKRYSGQQEIASKNNHQNQSSHEPKGELAKQSKNEQFNPKTKMKL
tara:strand:+ start:134 stop:277 length:144 start_codon:yes stop_codon:yes gene_type:complete